jgi:hypothetical protein
LLITTLLTYLLTTYYIYIYIYIYIYESTHEASRLVSAERPPTTPATATAPAASMPLRLRGRRHQKAASRESERARDCDGARRGQSERETYSPEEGQEHSRTHPVAGASDDGGTMAGRYCSRQAGGTQGLREAPRDSEGLGTQRDSEGTLIVVRPPTVATEGTLNLLILRPAGWSRPARGTHGPRETPPTGGVYP